MANIIQLLLDKYEIFLIVFVRTSGIFIVSPFFSSQNIPNTVKAGLTFFISIILTLVLDVDVNSLEINAFQLIVKELMVGITIGFICYLFLSAFYTMGQIIDMSMGFGMVNVIDPQNRIQVPLMGNFYYILAFLILLGINGHHVIIKALVDSYKFLPVGSFEFNENVALFLVELLSRIFAIGFMLSTPIIISIFLVDLILGILVRTIPQMNVFVVGLPLKILAGLIVMIITIPIFNTVVSDIINLMSDKVYEFFKM
jgi:flagellar biosynthetic protein FliR